MTLQPEGGQSDRAALAAWRDQLLRRTPVLLTGLYAWGLTVLPAMLEATAPRLAMWSGSLAAVMLLLSTLPRRELGAILLGVEGFVACSALSWWSLRSAGQVTQPGLFGLLGWVTYALAWGTLSRPSGASSGATEGSGLLERRLPASRMRSVLVFLVLLAAVLMTPLLLTAPLSIERDAPSVLSLVVAVSLLLLFMRVAADVGVRLYAGPRQRRASAQPKAHPDETQPG